MSSFNKQVTVPYTDKQMYDLGNDINTYSKLIPLCIPLLAALAFYGESTADQQLVGFRNDPEHRGLSCRSGWWRYSR